jgi:FKBP-type peptidyl-prolyl cis-trans isomerase FklB
MNSKFKLLVLFLCCTPLLFVSCGEENDTVDEYANWETRNTQYWDSIYNVAQQRISAGDTSWRVYNSWSLQDSVVTSSTYRIVVHIEQKGTGSGCPLYTDSVRVHYYGRLIPSASYPEGYLFNSSYSSDYNPQTSAPAQFLVSQLSDGFATALQHMHIGDRWEVYVPWPLGYGTDGSSSIPGYSVLRFNIYLQSYYHAGEDLPDFKAKSFSGWVE